MPDGSEPKFSFNPDVLSTNYVAAAAPYYKNGEASTTEFGFSGLPSASDSSWSEEEQSQQVVQPVLPDLNAAGITASGNNVDQPFFSQPAPAPLAVVASNLPNNGEVIPDTVDTAFFDTGGAGLGFNLPDVRSTAMWN